MPLEVLRGSKAIAAFVGVSQPTILRMIHAGEIPTVNVGGQLCAFEDQIVDALWRAAEQQQAIARDALERMAERAREAEQDAA